MFCVSSIGDTSERETQKEVKNLVFPYMEGEGWFFSFLGTFDQKKRKHKEHKEMAPGPEEEEMETGNTRIIQVY